MNSEFYFAIAFATIIAGTGCDSSSKPAEPAPQPREQQSLSSSEMASSSIAGYAHTFDKSKFRVGRGPSDLSNSGFLKVVGPYGVFAVDPVNHHAAGVANADSPTGTFTRSASDHEARVLSYFATAGVPSDQVGGVHSTVSAAGGGRGGDPDATRAMSIQYTSIVGRAIKGIPVAESHAWARFDDNDDVVAEDVYWPEIPTDALDEALTIADQLKDTATAAGFRAKLPAEVATAEGRVLIRHSSLAEHGSFVARGCYDVLMRVGGEKAGVRSGYTRHFGPDGTEFRLPQEMRQDIRTPRP